MTVRHGGSSTAAEHDRPAGLRLLRAEAGACTRQSEECGDCRRCQCSSHRSAPRARTLTQTAPAPAAIRQGSFPISILATAFPVSASSRVTLRSRLEATQTPPSPTATSTGPSPTGKLLDRVEPVQDLRPTIRDTVSSSKFATHSESAPAAIARGDPPTVTGRPGSGSSPRRPSTIAFAARFTNQNDPNPNAMSENTGWTALVEADRPGLEPDARRFPRACFDAPDLAVLADEPDGSPAERHARTRRAAWRARRAPR